MDLHYKQEISVGLLVLVAAALFVAGLTLLSGKVIGPTHSTSVLVRFTDVLGLKASDPVQISGVKVGRVESVELKGVGSVLVHLAVNNDALPHADATAAVSALDFFGAKYIAYSPGIAPEMLKDGVVIIGAREMALTEGAAGLAQRATEAIASAQSIFNQRTADDIHATMNAATRALDVVTKLGTGPQLEEATQAVKTLQGIAVRLDSILGNPAIKKSVDQLDELTSNLTEMTQGLASTSKALSRIMQKMDSGQGTFGRVMNDTTLYHDLRELSESMRKLLDDVRERPGRYINVKVF